MRVRQHQRPLWLKVTASQSQHNLFTCPAIQNTRHTRQTTSNRVGYIRPAAAAPVSDSGAATRAPTVQHTSRKTHHVTSCNTSAPSHRCHLAFVSPHTPATPIHTLTSSPNLSQQMINSWPGRGGGFQVHHLYLLNPGTCHTHPHPLQHGASRIEPSFYSWPGRDLRRTTCICSARAPVLVFWQHMRSTITVPSSSRVR